MSHDKFESEILAETILAASKIPNLKLFRNNVGSAMIQNRRVKFGLFPGSSDLIGFYAKTITQDMVGQTACLFIGVECKTATGRLSEEQERWHTLVKSFSALSLVLRSADDLQPQLEKQLSEK